MGGAFAILSAAAGTGPALLPPGTCVTTCLLRPRANARGVNRRLPASSLLLRPLSFPRPPLDGIRHFHTQYEDIHTYIYMHETKQHNKQTQPDDFTMFEKKDLASSFDMRGPDGSPYWKVCGGRAAVQAACKSIARGCEAYTFGGEGGCGYLKTTGNAHRRFEGALKADGRGWSTYIMYNALPKVRTVCAWTACVCGLRVCVCVCVDCVDSWCVVPFVCMLVAFCGGDAHTHTCQLPKTPLAASALSRA